MIRRALLALLLAVPVSAADRTYSIGSFDRIRVTGPFEVTHKPGSPGARVGGDPRAVERVELRVDGSMLTLRMGGQGWGERPRDASPQPVMVALSSPALTSAIVSAGGRLTAQRMRGARVDLSLAGSGAIAVADLDADQLVATMVGAGNMTLAGKARSARLASNGSGRMDAGKLETGDLQVLRDGPGETLARARYAARVTNTGVGGVTIAGTPKCTVSARGGGPVRCGKGSE